MQYRAFSLNTRVSLKIRLYPTPDKITTENNGTLFYFLPRDSVMALALLFLFSGFQFNS
jgi:hypothetical protein